MDQDDELAEWKSKTYQLVGRNVLLFQQMEHLLKFILPRSTVSISSETDVPLMVTGRRSAVETCTLGTLVKRFIAEVCDPNDPDPTSDAEDVNLTSTVRLRFNAPAERDVRLQRLDDLVKERNRLVHHLLSEVDFNSLASMRSIQNELEDQYQKVLSEIESLRQLVEIIAVSGAFVAHPEMGLEFVCGPIREHLVEKLRLEAGKSAHPDGWTSVSAAIQSDRPISSDIIRDLLGRLDIRNLSAFLEAVGGFEIRHDKDQKGRTKTFYRVTGTQNPAAPNSAEQEP